MSKIKYTLLLAVVLIIGTSAVVNNDKLFEITKNIELFMNVYKEVNKNYVDEVDPTELMRKGIDAMVGSLDPYTNYISESQVERYRISDDEKFQGIGVSVLAKDQKVYFSNPLEGGPSHGAGIRSGDQLVSINGTEVRGMDIEEIERNLRGVAGTPVNLVIIPKGSKNTKDVQLERGEVNISNVPYAGLVADDIGYINLTTFTENASANIAKELKKLKRDNDNLKGVIIDLRYNGGGLLREAVAITNLFLPKGTEVVTTKGKIKEEDRSFSTMAPPEDVDIPVAVLINGKSASASEIVSGVIQDTDRGIIVGQRSFGKGLVQNFFEVGYNSRVKVTTAKYYIPSGRCIQGVAYEDGKPVDIPDDKRSTFYTKNKRPVLDGGGVTPDIKLEEKKNSPFTQALIDQHILFEYANQYELTADSITDISSFKFDKYDDFVTFAKKQNFDYKLPGEEKVEELKQSLKDYPELSNSLQTEITQLQSKIKSMKADDFAKNKSALINEIEKELISRYHFQKGRTQISLRNDTEVDEAVRILKDQARYQKILKNK